jgi:peptidoglycan/xylan/chitin deacetylase (PgdA/CDA1 family)
LASGFRGALQETLKAAAAAVDVVRPRARGVAVLIYHRVGGQTGIENYLPEPLFRQQIEELAAGGRPVALGAALDVLAQPGAPAGPDPVVLSFDDGTSDFADVTVPLLARFRVPATLYLATDFIERGAAFPHNGRPLSWATLRDLLTTGLVTIGSHTHTHALFDRIDASQAADELERSDGLIEDRLGVTPRDFAYPKALGASGSVEEEVRRRFRSAALAGTRPNRYGRTDLHRLARSPVQRADGMRWFRRKVDGGMVLEDVVRRVSWRVRYSGRVS